MPFNYLLVSNNKKTNQLLNPEFEESNGINYDAIKHLNTNLALLSAVEIASSLTFKYTSLIKRLKQKGVTINLVIADDSISYGYVGTSKTSVSQHIFSREANEALKYMVRII